MKPKTKRLPKGPISKSDYVVEVIDRVADGQRVAYTYYAYRSDARAFAKSVSMPGVLVRTFRIKYSLVAVRK